MQRAGVGEKEEKTTCYVCQEGAERGSDFIQGGCTSGFVHLPCLVTAAQHKHESWTKCPSCLQGATGKAQLGLARAHWEHTSGLSDERPERLLALGHLAVALGHFGDLTRAQPLMRQAMEARERTLGKEHVVTLTSANNLGAVRKAQGELDKAEPLHRRALELRERLLGKEHPKTHTLVSILGQLLKDSEMGELAKAEPLVPRRRVSGSWGRSIRTP